MDQKNLKIKSFLRTSENAVKTQIWVAMIYYLLLAYIKNQAHYTRTMTVLALILKEQFMERLHLMDILTLSREKLNQAREPDYQLAIFLPETSYSRSFKLNIYFFCILVPALRNKLAIFFSYGHRRVTHEPTYCVN